MLSVVKILSYIGCHYTMWHYAECHYDDSQKAEYHPKAAILTVIMLSVVILSVMAPLFRPTKVYYF
jgi:hypothetical protein